MDLYERVLLVKNEVFMFRIPPLGATKGHKAADWNLEQPDWNGRLKLISIGEKLELRLEDKTTGQLYAKAPIAEPNGVDFEPVTDSSRYFVVRLRNDNGQTVFVGIGFADRSDSFDLNVGVQDHFKSVKRDNEMSVNEESTPKLDLGFKSGETITVKLPSSRQSDSKKPPAPKTDSSSGFLPPPPSSNSSRVRLQSMGPSIGAVQRLKKDYQKLVKDPVPYAIAAPLQSDILEWHYCIFGAPDTPYEGGYYHGKLVFPADFPFRPPSIYMITPSGRFQTNTRLCLSISDFHPDTWNPSWTVSSIITGLISFMNDTASTLGSINTSTQEKRLLAVRSRQYNLKDPVFCSVFDELAAKLREEIEEEQRISGINGSTANNEDEQPKSQNSRETSTLVANILMVVSLTALAIVIRYVINSTTT
ncbi:UBC core domain-containing protein [Aphelenchoides bicaudatus]|nr:UBC core domain-containing protein [Aphelenchoides bicaudatus]